MPKTILNDIVLRSLAPLPRGQFVAWDSKLSGFGCRVSQGGTKTFILKHRNRRITLGRYPVLSLADARNEAKRMLAEFEKSGSLKTDAPAAEKDGLALYLGSTVKGSLGRAKSFDELLRAFMQLGKERDYFATMAYVAHSEAVEKEIAAIRSAVRERKHLATTFGYGPRFLHSTGQLHKGGPNTGVFVVVTATPQADVSIPGKPFTFGTLELAQARGDFASLDAAGRRALHVHLPSPDRALLQRVCGTLLDGLGRTNG